MTNKNFTIKDANLINTGKFDEFVKSQKKKGKIKKVISDEIPDDEINNEGQEKDEPDEIPIKRNRKEFINIQ